MSKILFLPLDDESAEQNHQHRSKKYPPIRARRNPAVRRIGGTISGRGIYHVSRKATATWINVRTGGWILTSRYVLFCFVLMLPFQYLRIL